MAQMFCDQCGFQNRAGARFCVRCGNALREDHAGAEASARDSERSRAEPTTTAPAPRVRRPSRTVLAVLVAVLLIGLLYAAYSAMASRTYSDAVDAHSRFDCSQAADKYGQVAGFYYLALASHRGTARDRRLECRAVLKAESAAQEGSHRTAAELYAQIIDMHEETSPIPDKLRERRAEELLSWGDSLMRRASEDSANIALALQWYEKVLSEPQTSENEAAGKRMDRLWSSANSGNLCSRADSMMVLVEGNYVTDKARAIQSRAADRAPTYMLGCGNRLITEKKYRAAIRILRRLIREFRGTTVASRAQAPLIDAQVGQIRGGRTAELPTPVVSGRTGAGEAAVVIQNSTPYTIEVLLSGPSSRRFTVPRCTGCRKYSSPSEVTGCPPGPSRTFTLQPGAYSVVVRDVGRDVKPWAGDWRFDDGNRYDEGCFYIVTSVL